MHGLGGVASSGFFFFSGMGINKGLITKVEGTQRRKSGKQKTLLKKGGGEVRIYNLAPFAEEE